MYNILIIDDSEDDTLLLLRQLKKGGLQLNIQRVDSDPLVRSALKESSWDLVISDHNIPGYSSKEALETINELNSDLPVIIVSGGISEVEAIELMKNGAKDYVMKDSTARLIPAIEREITESRSRHAKKQAEEDLAHMAQHDAITGLANRQHYEQCVQEALLHARANNSSHVLMSLDLDQFKIINDTCSHEAGNELLKQVGLALVKHTNSHDTVARLGADEYGILLNNVSSEQVVKIADRMQNAIKNMRFTWDDKTFTTSISIGLANVTQKSTTVQNLITCADMACNAAKEKGHEGIQWFSENDPEYLQRRTQMHWANKIKQAIDDDLFVLHFQRMEGLQPHCKGDHGEFLVRLNDPDRLVYPGEFIPAAERYKLMPQLDRWVVRNAFKYLNESGLGLKEGGTFFINLSGTTLSDSAFFDDIRDYRTAYKINPKRVCFEITETTAIDNLSDAVEFIQEIREEGFKFALDDFGAGMSSFAYLKKIPVDYLKIDGSFVLNILKDRIDRSIVDACNGIAHAAGLQTIAEFVEDEATANLLKEIGVDFAQGYGIERPAPLN